MINRELTDYYLENLNNNDNNAKSVGWKNDHAQYIRFEQLTRIINFKDHFSINDLGCGIGHLIDFLKEKKSASDFKYYGYDVFDVMIEKAKGSYNFENVFFENITESSQMSISDYTIASGIFNLKYDKTEAEWLGYILNELDVMNRKSRLGFSFNMLTKYSDAEFKKEELYYADPCFIFDYCKRNFSRNVSLIHDYNEYDFTILVNKSYQ